jgi:hypothetical protein
MRRLLVALAFGSIGIAARGARAQAVILRIKPQVGDTLRMKLEQQSEMTGTRHTGTGDASSTVVTTMQMYSRAVVEKGSGDGTTVLAMTDSVVMHTTDPRTAADIDRAEAQMRGQRVRFRVAPDGVVSMVEADGGTPREVAQTVSLMPAAFPRGAIKVGESWIREMPVPSGSQIGAQASAKLHVTFRFDSLTHGGEWAFVSMRGEMRHAAGASPTTGTVLEKGVVTGTMLVDQRRGWLTDSWFAITVSSMVTPPLAAAAGPMHLQMRIMQHMHTLERR